MSRGRRGSRRGEGGRGRGEVGGDRREAVGDPVESADGDGGEHNAKVVVVSNINGEELEFEFVIWAQDSGIFPQIGLNHESHQPPPQSKMNQSIKLT